MMLQRILLALCISLAVSSGIALTLGRHVAPHGKEAPKLVYLAASKEIAAGQIVTEGDLSPIPWAEAYPLAGGIVKSSDATSRAALVALRKGQPVLSQYLSAPGAGSGLASRIPDGMRAIALRSDEIVGVGGFLSPGSHVDVLVTSRLGNAVEPSTVTALQNAEVIAIGQRSEPDPSGKPESATVVTLLLTPQDAERAVLASSQGSVHLVLRNNTDSGAVAPKPVSLSLLFGQEAHTSVPLSVPSRAVRLPAHGEGEDSSVQTVLDGVTQSAAAGTRGVL